MGYGLVLLPVVNCCDFLLVEELPIWPNCADSLWLGAIYLVLFNTKSGYHADLSMGLGCSHLSA